MPFRYAPSTLAGLRSAQNATGRSLPLFPLPEPEPEPEPGSGETAGNVNDSQSG